MDSRLSRYVAGLPETNNQTGLFLSAVGHFEHSVINAYLALMAMTAFVRQIGDDQWKPFEVEDGTTADRLNKLYNVIKHFDDRFEMGQKLGHPSVYPAPLWITNNGLAGHTTLVNGKEFKDDWTRIKKKDDVRHQDVLVTFDEFVTLLGELTENARFIIEGPTAPDPPAPPSGHCADTCGVPTEAGGFPPRAPLTARSPNFALYACKCISAL